MEKKATPVPLMLIVGLVIGLGACALPLGSGGTSWQEEVRLHDGRTIVVERSQSYGGRREIGQSPPIREQVISFRVPDSRKTITWKNEYGEDIGRANFIPIALHVLNGTPYFVTTPNLCLSYNKWGRPNPPYVFFKYEGEAWRRISIAEFPDKFREINLLIYTYGHFDVNKEIESGFVSQESVKKFNGTLTQPEYKAIVREVLANTWCPQYSSGPKAPIPKNADAPSK